MLQNSANSGRQTLAERGLDLYETPAAAVQALLRGEQIPHCVWEPAAGRGAIVRVRREAGHAIIASDIIDYEFPLHFTRDCLTTTKLPVAGPRPQARPRSCRSHAHRAFRSSQFPRDRGVINSGQAGIPGNPGATH